MFLRITATTNQRGERAKRRDSGFISDWGASLFRQVTSHRYRHGAVHLIISHFYASKMRVCSWGVLRGPCEAFITCNWGFVFLTAAPLTAFFSSSLPRSKSGVRAFVWHLSITSGHWGIPQFSLLTRLQAHMCFPLQHQAKGTHHPACYYPAPFHNNESFFLIRSGREQAFHHEHDEMQ